jgi:hypothetical protein
MAQAERPKISKPPNRTESSIITALYKGVAAKTVTNSVISTIGNVKTIAQTIIIRQPCLGDNGSSPEWGNNSARIGE